MAKLSKFQTSFVGGIVSPPMWGRIDLGKKYGSSLKACKNFLPRPQGGLMSRTGSTFLNDTELDGAAFELIEFHPNAEEAYVIEITDQSARAFPSDFIEDPLVNPVTTIGATPWLAAELKDLRWDYQADSVVITHPKHEPREIKFLGKGASPDFSISTLDFTTHPFQKTDKSGIVIRYVDDTNYLKIISSKSDEFDSISGKTHIEFKFDGQWQLAQIADSGDDFKDGNPVPDPSGDTCYVIPVVKMVQDFSKATKSVLVQKEYLQDTYPDNSVTEDQSVTLQYPDLTPGSVDYWWLRADTQVFSDDMVGAWVRFRSDYNKVYSSEDYADNEVRWGQILRRVGQEPHTTEFMVGPSFKELLEGHTYRAMRAGSGFQLSTNCPIETPSKLAWDLSFVYTDEGESFQPASVWWFETTGTGAAKSYTSQGVHPTNVIDFFSANTILEHLDTRISFDVAVLINLVGGPVGSDSHGNNLLTLTGEMTIDEEEGPVGSEDQLGHLGHIRSGVDFFYNVTTNPTGVRAGQYIMAKHDDEFVTYLVDTITSITEAQVSVVDGVLPIDVETEELYDEGRTSDYRISAWWTDNWPYTVAFHESRVVFGGSPRFPNNISISKLIDDLDFRTIENDGRVLDTTGITYPIPGKTFDRVNWMSSGAVLSIGVQNSEWQLRPNQFGAALTPINIRITEQTSNGSNLQPLSVNGILIFPDATNKKVVEYFFDFQQDKHVSRDITIFANELFYQDPVIDYCYQSDPFGVIWLVTESGRMVSLTYDRNQEVYAWAEHETLGRWVGVATFRATEDTTGEDRVLAYVERDLPSGTKTYAERMDPLIVQYVDKIYKYGLRTLDCVARVDTGGSGGIPPPPGWPPPPYVKFALPEYIDPWNFVTIDAVMASIATQVNLATNLWWDSDSNGLPMPGEDNDQDYLTAWNSEFSESYDNAPFAKLQTGSGNKWGAMGSVDFDPTIDDYWCVDLIDTFTFAGFGISFGPNPQVNPGDDPPPSHGIHTLSVYTAPASERADGELFVESNINWTLAETFDMSADWIGQTNGDHLRLDKELATDVDCRYLKFVVTDDWASNGDASNPGVEMSRIDYSVAIITAEQLTPNLTLKRQDRWYSKYRNFAPDWTWLGPLPDSNLYKAVDSAYTTLWDGIANMNLTPITYEMETLTDPKLFCRLLVLGYWLNQRTQPTNIEMWYKEYDDVDWVYYRHWRMPTNTYIPSGQIGNDFITVQTSLFGSSNAARAWHIPLPQKWYKAFKFTVYLDAGDPAIDGIDWRVASFYHMNVWDKTLAEDTDAPTITP